MTYLTFIVQHYDNLPDVMVFLHGHSNAWHQPISIAKMLDAINYSAVPPFINFRGCVIAGDDPSQTRAKKATDMEPPGNRWKKRHHVNYIAISRFWDELNLHNKYNLPGPLKYNYIHGPENEMIWGSLPIFDINSYCCAQFIVTRAAVQRLPLNFYLDAQQWTEHTAMANERYGCAKVT